MVTPIPGVEQRKKVQQELWKRKQVFGPFQGGEDWSMWRLENFVDNGDGDDERSIQSQDTPEAEILMTGTGTDAVLEQTEKMSKHGDGNPEQIPRPSAKPSSLELLERKPSNPSSPPSAPIRRADAIPPPHSKQQKVKLTLDLPDMEPAPSDRPWQPTCSIGFGSSDDDDDEFWTSIASCGLGTAAGGKCGAGRSHAGASAVWSDDSEDVDGLGDGGLASDVAGWSSE